MAAKKKKKKEKNPQPSIIYACSPEATYILSRRDIISDSENRNYSIFSNYHNSDYFFLQCHQFNELSYTLLFKKKEKKNNKGNIFRIVIITILEIRIIYLLDIT